MKFLGTLLISLLLVGMVVAEQGRLPQQLQNQNDVMHRSKTFWGFGSQVIKSATGGSSIKRVWDKRKGENKEETAVKEVSVRESPKYASYGIQAVYGSSPYAKGGFGSDTKTYGLSKQKMKRFVKKQVEPAPASEVKVAAGSTASEPAIAEPQNPSTS